MADLAADVRSRAFALVEAIATGKRPVKINLTVAFRRVPIPRQGLWQASCELVCTEGVVTLKGENARFIKTSDPRTIPVEYSTEIERSDSNATTMGAEAKAAAAAANLGSKREKGRRRKDAVVFAWKHSILEVILGVGQVDWIRKLPPAGEQYLECNETLWAEARVAADPKDTRFEVQRVIRDPKLLDREGNLIPARAMWGSFAKLLGRGTFADDLVEPVVTDIPFERSQS